MIDIPFRFNPEYTIERVIKTPTFRFGFGYMQSVTGRPYTTVSLTSVPLAVAAYRAAMDVLTNTGLTATYNWRIYTNWPYQPMNLGDMSGGYMQSGDWYSIDLALGSATVLLHYGFPNDLTAPLANLPTTNYGLGTRTTINKIGAPSVFSSGVTRHVPALQEGATFKTYGSHRLTWSGINAAKTKLIDDRLIELGGAIAKYVLPDRSKFFWGSCKNWSMTHLNNGFFDVSATVEECREPFSASIGLPVFGGN